LKKDVVSWKVFVSHSSSNIAKIKRDSEGCGFYIGIETAEGRYS